MSVFSTLQFRGFDSLAPLAPDLILITDGASPRFKIGFRQQPIPGDMIFVRSNGQPVAGLYPLVIGSSNLSFMQANFNLSNLGVGTHIIDVAHSSNGHMGLPGPPITVTV